MSSTSPLSVFVVGPPGAGKSTFCAATRDRFPDAISFSVRLRYQVLQRRRDSVALRIEEALREEHKYIPDDLVGELFRGFLAEVDENAIILLEGFPINAEQFRLAKVHLADVGRRIDKLLLLTADLAVLSERISKRRTCPHCEQAEQAGRPVPEGVMLCATCGTVTRQRPDDDPDHVQRRYHDFIRARDSILLGIDPDIVETIEVGQLSPEEVVSEGLQKLGLC